MTMTPDPLEPAAAPLPGGIPTDAEADAVVFACQRCGKPMPPMDGQLVALARSAGGISLAHEVCPDDDATTAPAPPPEPVGRYFEVRTQIVEVTGTSDVLGDPDQITVTELMSFRAGLRATDLDAAMRPLANELGQKWAKAEANAKIADTAQ